MSLTNSGRTVVVSGISSSTSATMWETTIQLVDPVTGGKPQLLVSRARPFAGHVPEVALVFPHMGVHQATVRRVRGGIWCLVGHRVWVPREGGPLGCLYEQRGRASWMYPRVLGLGGAASLGDSLFAILAHPFLFPPSPPPVVTASECQKAVLKSSMTVPINHDFDKPE